MNGDGQFAAKEGSLSAIRFRAMNTAIECLISPPLLRSDNLPPLAQAAPDWFAHAERIFSRFLPESELSKLNRAAGTRCLVSAAMYEVLDLAEHYRRLTGGLVTPFVGNAMLAAGYDQSFEQLPADREMRAETERAAGGNAEAGSLQLDPGMRSVLLPRHIRMDLGGIVKSWAVNRLALLIRSRYGCRRGLVNAGGDLIAWNGADDETPWLIGVEDPWSPGGEIGTLAFRDGAAATSSKLGRQWLTNRGVMHHLIDPRTMRPSASDVAQCTVYGEDPLSCEVWAKVFCIAGLEEGAALAEQSGARIEALIFLQDRKVVRFGPHASEAHRWRNISLEPYSSRERGDNP